LRILTIFKIQSKQFLRSKMAVFWVVLFPVLLMLLFGYVFSDVGETKYRLGVQLKDEGEMGEALLQAINQTGAFEVTMISHEKDPREAMEEEDLYVVLVIPDGFSQNLTTSLMEGGNRSVNVTVIYDPGRSDSGAEVGLLQAILSDFNMGVSGGRNLVGMVTVASLKERHKYIDFFTPGLISMAVMTSSLFTAVSVNTEYRQKGILKKLATTPIKPWEWVGGIILYILFTTLLAIVAILAVGVGLFSLKVDLNIYLPLFVILDVLTFAGIGMIIGRWVREAQSADAAANAVMFPMMFLSGIFWPIEMMPHFLQVIAHLLPLYYMGEGLRDAMVYGRYSDASVNALIVLGMALVFFAIGALTTKLREE